MRPNLSVEKIAGALAVLGTSALMAACGGDKPANAPVNSTEAPTTGGEAKPADGHCGAAATHKPGEASCGAATDEAKPADTSATAAPATPAAGETPAAPDTKAADAKPADAKADPKAATATPTPTTAKKPAKPAAKKGGGASCGAGTCSAKK